jgi:hypothetical protein
MIIPMDMTIAEFSRALALEYSNVPFYNEGDDWQRWASSLQIDGAFASYILPSPYLLTNKKEWMEVFTGTIN